MKNVKVNLNKLTGLVGLPSIENLREEASKENKSW